MQRRTFLSPYWRTSLISSIKKIHTKNVSPPAFLSSYGCRLQIRIYFNVNFYSNNKKWQTNHTTFLWYPRCRWMIILMISTLISTSLATSFMLTPIIENKPLQHLDVILDYAGASVLFMRFILNIVTMDTKCATPWYTNLFKKISSPNCLLEKSNLCLTFSIQCIECWHFFTFIPQFSFQLYLTEELLRIFTIFSKSFHEKLQKKFFIVSNLKF